jgi:hypothetical protein
VLGFVALTIGDDESALRWLADVPALLDRAGYRLPSVFPVVPDAIEALVLGGRLDEAAAVTDQLEERATGTLTSALVGRCRGLLAAARAELPTAAVHLERALDLHAAAPSFPFEHARTLLAAAEVNRRASRRRPARLLLEEALTLFERTGAAAWARRARSELARVGVRPADDL